MKRNTKFRAGVSGNPARQWKPGQSGNPSGRSKARLQFEQNFNDALITHGSPEEAAQLLWEAARKHEPWAIQDLCRRFAPEDHSLRLVQEVNNDGIDYTKLSDQQLEQLHTILAAANAQSDASADGKSKEKSA